MLPGAFENNGLCKIWGANRVHCGGFENREFIFLEVEILCTFWSERVRLHESNISSTDKKVLSVKYIRGIPCLLLASEKETKEMNNTENDMHFCMPNFPLSF